MNLNSVQHAQHAKGLSYENAIQPYLEIKELFLNMIFVYVNVNNEDNVQYIVDFCYLNINNLGYKNGKELIESHSINLKVDF